MCILRAAGPSVLFNTTHYTFMSRNYSRQIKTANQIRRSYKKDK